MDPCPRKRQKRKLITLPSFDFCQLEKWTMSARLNSAIGNDTKEAADATAMRLNHYNDHLLGVHKSKFGLRISGDEHPRNFFAGSVERESWENALRSTKTHRAEMSEYGTLIVPPPVPKPYFSIVAPKL